MLKAKEGYSVLFQSSEGVSSNLILVPASVNGNKLSFQLSESDRGYSGLFSGVIFSNRLECSFSNGQLSPSGLKIFKLKKKRSCFK